ncbi:MAG: AMP-binding protein, partial [Iodobacter sp.]
FVVADGPDGPLSFAGFSLQVAGWQAAFAASPGQRFALFFNHSIPFAAALLGAWHAGKCVYLPGDALPATLQRLSLETDGFAGDLPAAFHPLTPAYSALPDWQPLNPDAIQLVVYTSGSGGEPGAITKKLSQLFSEVTALHTCFGVQAERATTLATVSHQHIYGLLFRILWPLSAGLPFASARLIYPEDIASALRQTPNALLISSPAHLKRLPAGLDWSGAAHLQLLFSSGGPLPDEALPDCRTLLGQAPVEVYGSSETGGVAWRQRHQTRQTSWQALPGVEIKIENEMMLLRSPHLSDGEWQAGSDRIELRADGFELLGRADRIIKIEEKRLSLTAAEQTLLATGLLSEARLLALPGARLTLALIAVPASAGWQILDTQGKQALNQTLKEALALQFEAGVLPRRFRYIQALPANMQGKTTEAALLTLFDARRPEARLLEHGPGSALFAIEVNAGSPFFNGHFAGSPVLPGVAQIDWALRLARELFQLPSCFLRLENIKFQQVILPGHQVQLSLKITEKAGESLLGFDFSSPRGRHASGRIVLGAQA